MANYQFEHSLGAAKGEHFRIEIPDFERGKTIQAQYLRGAEILDLANDEATKAHGRNIMKRAVRHARKLAV